MAVTRPDHQPGTEPAMTSSHQDTPTCQWFPRLASALDPRSAPRLARLLHGAVLARGRRTVTSWTRAVGLSREYKPCYTTVAAAGKQADNVSARLVNDAVRPLVADQGRLTLALDDTPTPRHGPHVPTRAAAGAWRHRGRRRGRRSHPVPAGLGRAALAGLRACRSHDGPLQGAASRERRCRARS